MFFQLLLMVWEVLYAVGAHAILPLLPRFNHFNMWIQGIKIEGRDKWNDHRTYIINLLLGFV